MSISNLIINKASSRKKILALFFQNEDNEYYLREIEKLTGVPSSNIKRDLKKLENDKFFLTNRVGNLLFYKLNKKHPHYKEIKKIVMSEIGIEFELINFFNTLTNIKFAFIYGSYASKKNTSNSDIDLMIVGEPLKNLIGDKIFELERSFQKEINYQIISYDVFKQKISDNNSFITEILKNKKIVLIGTIHEL